MNPTDFLDLADQLATRDTEAAFRTAVSRAYYGAFHTAAALIREMGVTLPAGPESHQKVRFCLMESGEPPGLQAGDSLQILRQDRNQADYDLDGSTTFSAKTAQQRIRRARAVQTLLHECREEPIRKRFRAKMRDYAANVLKLPVTDG